MNSTQKDRDKSPSCKKVTLAHGWEPRISESYPDRVYYWNRFTGNAVWEIPKMKTPTESDAKSTCSSSSSKSSGASTSLPKPPVAETKLTDSSKKAEIKALTVERRKIKRPFLTQDSKAESASNSISNLVKSPIKLSTTTTFKRKNTLNVAKKVVDSVKKSGKSPLLRGIVQISAAPSSIPELDQSIDTKDSGDCNSDNDPISDMEIELIPSEDEDALASDVEMEDISKEIVNNFIKTKEGSVSKVLHIVIDTNILIDHLNLVVSLKDQYLEGSGHPILVIPWMVLTELNRIKDNKNRTKSDEVIAKARKAVRFLNTVFQTKHPRVKGQIDTQDKTDFDKNQPSLNWDEADDRILYCCIQIGKQIGSDKVVLLTDDKNLMNRIMCVGLRCCNSDGILQFLKENYDKELSVNKSFELTAEDKIDEAMRSSFDILKDCLTPILEERAKEVIGVTWMTVVFRKPPWTLLDMLENISKHWAALFAPILNISSKSHLETMKEIYRDNQGYIHQNQACSRFLVASCHFLSEIKKISDPSYFESAIDKIKGLKENICDLFAEAGETVAIPRLTSHEQPTVTCLSPLKCGGGGVANQRDRNTVLNLEYIWKHVFVRTTCLIMDALRLPHDLEYNDALVPLKRREAIDMLPKIFPLMRKIRSSLLKILVADKSDDDSLKNHLKLLHQHFSLIPSSLNLKLYLTSPLNLNDLEAIVFNSDYREFLVNSYMRLNDLFAKLQLCTRTVSVSGDIF